MKSVNYADIEKVATISRLPLTTFSAIRCCFGRLVEHPKLKELLLSQPNRWPLYRFCPQCWSTDRVPYLRLEWRFKHWRFCPTHRVQLQMRCPCCHNILAMHRATLGGTLVPSPVLTLAHCLFCGTDTRRFQDGIQKSQSSSALDPEIRFQRAVVSAVLHGYFSVEPFLDRRPLNEMLTLINGVGLEAPDEQCSRLFSKMGSRDLKKLEWILGEACKDAKWLRLGNPKRSSLARQAFDLWRPVPRTTSYS
jgi:hypothetical protein